MAAIINSTNSLTTTMDLLTNDAINTLAALHGSTVHPTSAGYIRTLLKPYVDALVGADIKAIEEWLPLAIPGDRNAVELIGIISTDDTIPDKSTAAVKAIIHYIVEMFIVVIITKDNELLPWDIQRGISENGTLSKMFAITMNKLPIDVVIGGKQFTHEVTEEFAAGLALFKAKDIGDAAFTVSMFGEPFALKTDRYNYDDDQLYAVDVGTETYGFQSPDFMTGFATGAMWEGVDHHLYWKNLTMNEGHGNLVIRKSLTF